MRLNSILSFALCCYSSDVVAQISNYEKSPHLRGAVSPLSSSGYYPSSSLMDPRTVSGKVSLASDSAADVRAESDLRPVNENLFVTSDSSAKQESETITNRGKEPEPEKRNPRKFVRYEPSEWEKLWFLNIDEWQNGKKICEVMYTEPHMSYMHEFLNITCTHRFMEPYNDWCLIDDHLVGLWYNTANLTHYDLHWEKPAILKNAENPRLQSSNPTNNPLVLNPTSSSDHKALSKFIYRNEVTEETFEEYIEPLVSHLRWPLSHCYDDPDVDQETYKYHGSFFRGWIIPPPPTNQKPGKKLLFDAGASDWMQGAGGPSLNYFTKKWMVQDYDFDSVNAYEMVTNPKVFYDSVPKSYMDRAHYQKCAVSSQPEDHSADHPFLPIVIQETATDEDYVLFKLDIDSPQVESGNIEYILNQLAAEKKVDIDELFWEHHIRGNYLMTEWGDPELLDDITLLESYTNFLKMRQKGIRAHSWV
mmetsp:Transcript_10262/g.11451  ORF Transcript_10262/g.11451 Transcript_10262/m.11451 type:complete len:476 (-) Transcript_10262:328-1755(-)